MRRYRAGNQPTSSKLLPAEVGAEAEPDKWPTIASDLLGDKERSYVSNSQFDIQ